MTTIVTIPTSGFPVGETAPLVVPMAGLTVPPAAAIDCGGVDAPAA